MTSFLADLCARTVADSAWGEDCTITVAGVSHSTRATTSHKEETDPDSGAVLLRSRVTVPFADFGFEPPAGSKVSIGGEQWNVDVSLRKSAVLTIHLTKWGI